MRGSVCVCVCVVDNSWTKSQLSPSSHIRETFFLLAVAHFRPLKNEPLQEPFCMLSMNIYSMFWSRIRKLVPYSFDLL